MQQRNNILSFQSEYSSLRLEDKVRFSLKYCMVGKNYCIKKLERDELRRLYKTLGNFEEYTWKQFVELPRENGLSKEKADNPTSTLLRNWFPFLDNFGHIRVDACSTPFRVFGSISKNIFYILLFDRKGEIQGH